MKIDDAHTLTIRFAVGARPTLPAKSRAAHDAIVALLREFSPHSRDAILANVCTTVHELSANDRQAVQETR